jgi:hypothetical protein
LQPSSLIEDLCSPDSIARYERSNDITQAIRVGETLMPRPGPRRELVDYSSLVKVCDELEITGVREQLAAWSAS